MFSFKLPFDMYFGCEICGFSSNNRESVGKCEAMGITEKPGVRIGDVVSLYQNAWLGNRFVGMTEKPEPWTVTELYYASPATYLCSSITQRPKIHVLCIRLSQFNPGGKEPRRELRRSDLFGGFSSREMTYAEFLLWREGDRDKLENAGLVATAASTHG